MSFHHCEWGLPHYRYTLRKTLDWAHPGKKGSVLWVMLNPSTANEQKLDPTLTRCWHFTHAWGYAEMIVVNLFAFRSPHPSEMMAAEDPIGPRNNYWIEQSAAKADLVLCAWGNGGNYFKRAEEIKWMLKQSGRDLFCLGTTSDGSPIHPLARGKHRIANDAKPVPYAA